MMSSPFKKVARVHCIIWSRRSPFSHCTLLQIVFHSISLIMFRRQLLRQQRALIQRLSQSSPIQKTPFSLLQPNAPRIASAYPSRIARRWQTDDAAKKEAEAPSETAPAEATPEDVLKKELEAKIKEAKDMKVRGSLSRLTMTVY